ncbi:MAG: PIN domain protein [Bacteroidetes bacterium GWF2_38_335]|nr:MAG: PIN domain protein [Bacteroidetes bacterium GWF2_38_335]OFY78336.1 MAG: PIN domain protein [Bacteroidetes bacterium RIFOXYA12_FULL_38_20]HBS87468.1 PIN domain protein [Bacteroidales bacterium]
MKQRIYIDTSVVGGYHDTEFMEFTRPLFEKIRNGEVTIIYSSLLERELQNAPENVKDVIKLIPKDFAEYIEISTESITLARKYIEENVVGKTSFDDCLHIALATLTRADILVSWNFKHIVNVKRIRGYNSVNLKYGYHQIDIRSPRELMDYE